MSTFPQLEDHFHDLPAYYKKLTTHIEEYRCIASYRASDGPPSSHSQSSRTSVPQEWLDLCSSNNSLNTTGNCAPLTSYSSMSLRAFEKEMNYLASTGKALTEGTSKLWPESLRKFVEDSMELYIDRKPSLAHEVTKLSYLDSKLTMLMGRRDLSMTGMKNSAATTTIDLRMTDDDDDIDQVLMKPGTKMSSKKHHEMTILGDRIAELAHMQDLTHVADIGGGQGYLSLQLALKKGLNVVCIDGDVQQLEGARKRLLHARSAKHNNPHSIQSQRSRQRKMGTLDTKEHWITKTDTLTGLVAEKRHDSNSLTTTKSSPSSCVVEQHIVADMSTKNNDEEAAVPEKDWLVTGLHTCGDLATSTLRIFARSEASALITLGCCYNHISPDDFPLSDMARKARRETHFSFTRDHGMLATQTPQRWIEKDNEHQQHAHLLCKASAESSEQQQADEARPEDDATFLKHWYRAVLQTILDAHHIAVPREGTGKIRPRFYRQGFATYAREACRRMGISLPPIFSDSELDNHIKKTEAASGRRQMILCISLRVLLAPLVEIAILIDRFVWLLEQGLDAALIPLFDPVISPRNMALVAIRTQQQQQQRKQNPFEGDSATLLTEVK